MVDYQEFYIQMELNETTDQAITILEEDYGDDELNTIITNVIERFLSEYLNYIDENEIHDVIDIDDYKITFGGDETIEEDYKQIADCYRIAVGQGKLDKEIGKKEIKIFDFLSTCDEDDLCRLINTGAFNEIIMAYTRYAAASAGLDEYMQNKVTNQLYSIFDEKTTEEILDK